MSSTRRDVTVWFAWRDAPLTAGVQSRLAGALVPDELRRAARYRHRGDADAFRWTRSVQRAILGAHLAVPAAALQFGRRGDGKPILAGRYAGRCEYNASHSGTLFALAIADTPVGVDVERTREVPRLESVSHRVFDAATAAAIGAAGPHERTAVFFRAWTALEAHAKLHGAGVWRLLAQREQHAAAEGVQIAPLEAPQGYHGAVAVAGAEPRVTVKWWPADTMRDAAAGT